MWIGLVHRTVAEQSEFLFQEVLLDTEGHFAADSSVYVFTGALGTASPVTPGYPK